MKPEKKDHPHHGHRKRMTKNFMSSSKASLTDVQFVEMLLFYCIPRSDTNPIAHALLDRFGNIRNLFGADENEIASVEGMGNVSASKLKSIARLAYRHEKAASRRSNDHSLSIDTITSSIISKMQELFYSTSMIPNFMCLCFSSEGELLFCRVFEKDLETNLKAVANSFPSKEDILMILCVSKNQSHINPDNEIDIEGLDTEALRRLKIDVLARIYNDRKINYKII